VVPGKSGYAWASTRSVIACCVNAEFGRAIRTGDIESAITRVVEQGRRQAMVEVTCDEGVVERGVRLSVCEAWLVRCGVVRNVVFCLVEGCS